MRQPDPKMKRVPAAADLGRRAASSLPGLELGTQALTDFKNGNYRDGFRNANMAGADVLLHGIVPNQIDWERHPRGIEAASPVWGTMREGLADLDDNNYAGAILNTGQLAADAFGANSVVRAVEAETALTARLTQAALNNRGVPAKDPRNWKRVRRGMGQVGLLEKGQHGHHWLIPQNGWGKTVPNALKNRPWNIMPMVDDATHHALHGNFGAKLASPLQRFIQGTPTGWKALNADAALRAVGAASRHRNDE